MDASGTRSPRSQPSRTRVNRLERQYDLVLGFGRPDTVRHAGAARPKRLLRPFGGVVNRLMLDLSIQLSPDQNDGGGEPHPGHKADHGPQRAIGLVVSVARD